jgi:hypothetical protein
MLEVGCESSRRNAGPLDRHDRHDRDDRDEKPGEREEPLHAGRSSHGIA